MRGQRAGWWQLSIVRLDYNYVDTAVNGCAEQCDLSCCPLQSSVVTVEMGHVRSIAVCIYFCSGQGRDFVRISPMETVSGSKRTRPWFCLQVARLGPRCRRFRPDSLNAGRVLDSRSWAPGPEHVRHPKGRGLRTTTRRKAYFVSVVACRLSIFRQAVRSYAG